MANYTTNLSLKKPVDSEGFDIADFNGNADKIDAAFGAGYGVNGADSVAQAIGKIKFEEYNGNATVYTSLPKGFWRLTSTKASAMTDAPSGQSGVCYVIKGHDTSDQDFIKLFVTGNKKEYHRVCYGTWGNWEELALKSELTALSEKVDVQLVSSVPFETGKFECTTAQTIDNVTIPAYSIYDCKVYGHDGAGTVIRLSTGDMWSISGIATAWDKCKALT